MAGKVATAMLALAVIAGGISWWRMDEAARASVVAAVGWTLAWVAMTLLLPWVTFFVSTRAARADSNAAGFAVIAGYTAIDVLAAVWLLGWSISGAAEWAALIVGTLFAGAYNLLTCDWIAERADA